MKTTVSSRRTYVYDPATFVGPVFYRSCTECGEGKVMFDFSFHAASKRQRNPVCKVCNAAKSRKYHADNPDKVKAAAKAYRAENAEALKQRKADYFQTNKVKIVAERREYRKNKPEYFDKYWADYYAKKKDDEGYQLQRKLYRQRPGVRARFYEKNRKAREADPEGVAAYMRKYIAERKAADPNYLHERTTGVGASGFISRSAMEGIRAHARHLTRITGVKHNVDHIYPLVNPWVCGLNIAANLRVVTAKVNQAKHNKLLKSLEHEHWVTDPWYIYDDTQEPQNA